MINEVIISKLDELVGEYDTPFFNYLLYSYDLSLDDCEVIIDDLKSDINSNKILPQNIVLTLEDYFKSRVADLEKQQKIEFLEFLLQKDNDFFMKFLKKYNLSDKDIHIVYSKVKDKILKENITDFEIKRYLEYYFENSVKQVSYIRELNQIVGNNYDTLIIKKAKKDYPILLDVDIVQIIFKLHTDILESLEFKKGIKHEFLRRCMIKSEDKKANARHNLNIFVEGKGDSFLKLTKFKRLSKKDAEIIVCDIEKDISHGLIQPKEIDGVFITRRVNEYLENER